MSDLNQTIAERVAEVAEDLELQAGLKLSNKQLDELRITGRVTIDLVTIAPYLPKIIKYLHHSDDEDVVWSLIINTISGDADITLKGCQLML